MTIDERQRAKTLRRDAELAQLVDELRATDSSGLAEKLIGWGMARDAERRSLAEEALERYRELNLLYDMAERSASLDPATIIRVATTEVGRLCRRGVSVALVTDEEGRRIRPLEHVYPTADGAPRSDAVAHAGIPTDGLPMGEGIIGGVAGGRDGEIVNDPSSDERATEIEAALGALMVAPLRAGDHKLGVLLVTAPTGAEFTAGEHRMLSAVAALTSPALDAAMTHVRTVAVARAREAELERQLDALRSGVDERRREERVSEITSSEYFQALRQQADDMRRALKAESDGGGR